MKYILMMNTMRAGQGVPQWDQKVETDHKCDVCLEVSPACAVSVNSFRTPGQAQGAPGALSRRSCQSALLLPDQRNFGGSARTRRSC